MRREEKEGYKKGTSEGAKGKREGRQKEDEKDKKGK